MVGLGVGPPCLRVDSEETLLTLTEEQAQLACAAPGVTLVDSSETGAPVRELIWPSVLGEPLVDCLQEPMPVKKWTEYAIQAKASVWMPFEQVHCVVSGEVDFDSFGMAPWDAGGMHGDRFQLREALQTMMLQWLMRLLCRPVIMHGLDRTIPMNTENRLDMIMMITTDSPRLTVTPGEWYASDVLTQLRRDLRQTYGIPEVTGAMYDCRTVWGSPRMYSAAVDCNAVEKNMVFHRLSLPPEELSAGRDGNYGFPKIDSAAVDYGTGAVRLDDLIFRCTIFPPDEFSAGRNGDYIWRVLWTGSSVCNRPVMGSPTFGSSH